MLGWCALVLSLCAFGLAACSADDAGNGANTGVDAGDDAPPTGANTGVDSGDDPADAPPTSDAAGDTDSDAGGGSDAGGSCVVAADCQDGSFCNGYETCAPGTASADPRGCVAGAAPCADAASCNEDADVCEAPACDPPPECGPLRSACPVTSYCEGRTTCQDGTCVQDPPVVCSAGLECIEARQGECSQPCVDCDDGLFCNGRERCVLGACEPGTPPACGAAGCNEALDICLCQTSADCDDGQFCNGLEYCRTDTNLCDTLTFVCAVTCMEGQNSCGTCTSDSDCSDGQDCNGTELCESGVCRAPAPCVDADRDGHNSMSQGGADCDDNDPQRAPGRPEVCDAGDVDEDCDPTTFGNRDQDGDGYFDAYCCNGSEVTGDQTCGDDCNDLDGNVHPTASEVCNQVDDDCNSEIDEGVQAFSYRDRDGDGHGDSTCTALVCAGTLGWATVSGDCDDTNVSLKDGSTTCAADGSGVRTCRAGVWEAAPCGAGTSCRPQPDGTGLCL